MGQWVRCTLEKDDNLGDQKLVRHLNLDYYVGMERNPITLRCFGALEPELSKRRKSCSRNGNDWNQRRRY